MNKARVFFVFYILLNFCLLLYSYTQVDLSLTFSHASIFQTIEKSFQNIGWYQRPLSTTIFLIILSLMFGSYLYLLYLAKKNKITRKFFWGLLIISSCVLAFSYNAFSYDLFNYIFDAKILTHYHQNPYLHKALDYTSDPMLSFMRWTHRTYPYGPVWLAITTPLSIIGLNIFILTFFIFKFAIAGFFLGSIWFLEKIVNHLKIDNKFFPLVLFAFNPITVIESLVSSHNDIVMMFFALAGFYFFLKRKWVLSILLVIASFLIKTVTVFLLIPIILSFFEKFIKISLENVLRITALSLLAASAYVLTQKEIQPWYFLWVFPFIALLKPNRFIISTTIFFTIGLLLTYMPVVGIGNYVSGGSYKLEILPTSILIGLIFGFIYPFIAKASVINRFFV